MCCAQQLASADDWLQGVRPRRAAAEPTGAGDRGSSGGSLHSSSPPSGAYPFLQTGAQLQEWHPNQRPGLLELPSRLFAALATGSGAA
jgi:hypothetical protein